MPDFARPPSIFFDDLAPGDGFELGAYTLTQPEIVRFSQEWAPHQSHVDEEVAAAGFFGGIVAPVSQTYAACARLVTINSEEDGTVVLTVRMQLMIARRAPRVGGSRTGSHPSPPRV
jgi:acyl dehydratase